MDGAFSINDHPTCNLNLGLPLLWDIYANILNMNLSRELVEKFWNNGLAYGV